MEVNLPRKPTGSGRFARLEAWVAVFIALTSVAITLWEARATREHDRMSVWPRLAQESSDSAGIFTRTITNVGLGPALVRSYALRVDGAPFRSWNAIVAALLGPSQPVPGFYFSTVGPGTVILPGKSIQVVTISGPKMSGLAMAQDHRLIGHLCYCSLYEECWTVGSNEPNPTSVKACDHADTTTVGR